MRAWGLSPFLLSSSPAFWPRGGGKRSLGGRSASSLPGFLLLGAGCVGATPQSHSLLSQPSLSEKLVQLFCSTSNSFFFGEGCPRPRGPWPSDVPPDAGLGSLAGSVDCRLPAAPTPPGSTARRPPPGGIWVSGQFLRPRASFGTRRSDWRWGGDTRLYPLLPPRGVTKFGVSCRAGGDSDFDPWRRFQRTQQMGRRSFVF